MVSRTKFKETLEENSLRNNYSTLSIEIDFISSSSLESILMHYIHLPNFNASEHLRRDDVWWVHCGYKVTVVFLVVGL